VSLGEAPDVGNPDQRPREMRDDVSQMKWWGWGDEDIEFDASDKPFLMPFITRELGLSEEDERW